VQEQTTQSIIDPSSPQDGTEFQPPVDWDGVPRHYVHQNCGTVTPMPEHVIQTYLADPCFYFMPDTTCAKCGSVPDSRCVWVETGERLDKYMNRLKRQKSTAYHATRFFLPLLFGLLGAWFWAVDPLDHFAVQTKWDAAIGLGVGTGIGLFVSRFIRLGMCHLGLI
jgi:hypothetical protein